MKQRTKGFTVLELLMVISIILILFGMLMMGLNSAQRQARVSATKTRLQNVQAMLQNLEANASLAYVQNAWSFTDSTGTYTYTSSIPAPSDVTINPPGSLGLPANYRTINMPVVRTQMTIVQLLRVPDNKATFYKLPTNDMIQCFGLPAPANPPVLADAWGNPMIFVPPGGLTGVSIGGTLQASPIKAPDGKGFWASAGPDGNFANGDDNVYSFVSGK